METSPIFFIHFQNSWASHTSCGSPTFPQTLVTLLADILLVDIAGKDQTRAQELTGGVETPNAVHINIDGTSVVVSVKKLKSA